MRCPYGHVINKDEVFGTHTPPYGQIHDARPALPPTCSSLRVTPTETCLELAVVAVTRDGFGLAIQNARLFREIEDKSKQLAQTSEHKSQFVSSVSHELRTPLTDMLVTNAARFGTEKAKEPLQRVHRAGTLCVLKTRFGNSGDEGRRGRA